MRFQNPIDNKDNFSYTKGQPDNFMDFIQKKIDDYDPGNIIPGNIVVKASYVKDKSVGSINLSKELSAEYSEFRNLLSKHTISVSYAERLEMFRLLWEAYVPVHGDTDPMHCYYLSIAWKQEIEEVNRLLSITGQTPINNLYVNQCIDESINSHSPYVYTTGDGLYATLELAAAHLNLNDLNKARLLYEADDYGNYKYLKRTDEQMPHNPYVLNSVYGGISEVRSTFDAKKLPNNFPKGKKLYKCEYGYFTDIRSVSEIYCCPVSIINAHIRNNLRRDRKIDTVFPDKIPHSEINYSSIVKHSSIMKNNRKTYLAKLNVNKSIKDQAAVSGTKIRYTTTDIKQYNVVLRRRAEESEENRLAAKTTDIKVRKTVIASEKKAVKEHNQFLTKNYILTEEERSPEGWLFNFHNDGTIDLRPELYQYRYSEDETSFQVMKDARKHTRSNCTLVVFRKWIDMFTEEEIVVWAKNKMHGFSRSANRKPSTSLDKLMIRYSGNFTHSLSKVVKKRKK